MAQAIQTAKTIKCVNPKAVAARAFQLAFQAAGGTKIMGEAEIWDALQTGGSEDPAKPGEAYGGLVFDRKLNFGLAWNAEGILVSTDTPVPDKQAWSRTYNTYEDLVLTARVQVEGTPKA